MTSSQPAAFNSGSAQKRRLVVLSDGTWADNTSGSISNVAELDRLLTRGKCSDGVQQLVRYDVGIGVEGNVIARLLGGGIGRGIDKNIKELYLYLAENYRPGDEIYMFGWSRGAYTVRSLCGMIYEAGLVQGDNVTAENADAAYEFYRSNRGADSADAKAFRDASGGRVPVAVVGCFDTVGALGVPWFYFLNAVKYAFHNTTLSTDVRLGLHVVAVDEEVKAFSPTPMESERVGQVVERYFPGNHGGVGGGNFKELSYLALGFVVDAVRSAGFGLEFNQAIPAGDPRAPEPEKVRFDLLQLLTGRLVRQIDRLDQLDDSVRVRYRSVPKYRPDALAKFEPTLLE